MGQCHDHLALTGRVSALRKSVLPYRPAISRDGRSNFAKAPNIRMVGAQSPMNTLAQRYPARNKPSDARTDPIMAVK